MNLTIHLALLGNRIQSVWNTKVYTTCCSLQLLRDTNRDNFWARLSLHNTVYDLSHLQQEQEPRKFSHPQQGIQVCYVCIKILPDAHFINLCRSSLQPRFSIAPSISNMYLQAFKQLEDTFCCMQHSVTLLATTY